MALAGSDAEEEADRFRETSSWPRFPWVAVKRAGEARSEFGLVFADDVTPPPLNSQAADRIRVFATTADTARALMGQTLIDGRRLPIVVEYDSIEELIADGWQGDG
jgi:hypothetical protein